jgi:nucleoside-diphosphate-sugar epimerase
MSFTVLILGAKGRFGLSAAQAFAAAGWRVLGQVRPGATPKPVPGVEWLAVDLNDHATLVQQAQGAQVVVHALNPLYTNAAWQAQVLPMTDAALQISTALDATLMVPGNVYNFGADAPALLQVQTPQHAHTVKGKVRMAMEQRLAQSSVQTIVIRAGDFFGQGTGSWFDTVVAKELPKGVLRYPAANGVHTAWAYLPDLARTFVLVAEKRAVLGAHTALHFAGHNLCAADWQRVLAAPVAQQFSGANLCAGGGTGVGQPPAIKALPWWGLRVGGWFNPVLASLFDMRYLWQRPYALDNFELVRLIGEEPRTPLAQAAQCAMQELYPAKGTVANNTVTVAV